MWDYSTLTVDGIIRVATDPTGIRTTEAVGQEDGGDAYDLSGRKISGRPRGFYIRNGKKYFGR